MFSLISNLARAAAAYLEIRRIDAHYNLSRRISNDIIHDMDEVDRLRALGDPRSQQLADRLRDRLAAAQGIALALPAAGPAPAAGQAGGDAGRSLHAPGAGGVAQ